MNCRKQVRTTTMQNSEVNKMCDLGISIESFNPRVLYIGKHRVTGESVMKYNHHDHLELKYILSGTCLYQLGEETYRVKKGDIIVCNAGTFHHRTIIDDEEMQELNIGINNIDIRNLPKNHLIDFRTCPVIKSAKYELEILKCCSEILQEQEKHEPGCEIILRALVMKLLVLFLKENIPVELSADQSRISFESSEKGYIVSTIVSFINENYMKEISLERISRNMYLSPVYISKIFKEETGESPINYLIKIRLAKAMEMLQEGTQSVKTIAKSIGYHDAYYFSKLFKKYYGSPPSRHKAG
jgi:AraC-like DNA-binding protein